MRSSSELVISNDGTTINGAAIDCSQVFAGSLMVVTTSTLTGTAKLQFSNDLPVPGHVPSSWVDITSASVAVAAAGAVGIMKLDLCYNFIRVVWTKTANTGTLKCYLRTNAV